MEGQYIHLIQHMHTHTHVLPVRQRITDGKTVNGKYEREAYVTLAFWHLNEKQTKQFDSAFSFHASMY